MSLEVGINGFRLSVQRSKAWSLRSLVKVGPLKLAQKRLTNRIVHARMDLCRSRSRFMATVISWSVFSKERAFYQWLIFQDNTEMCTCTGGGARP